jgi:hypothetical protein
MHGMNIKKKCLVMFNQPGSINMLLNFYLAN